MTQSPIQVIVVGAGIVGVSTAIWLQRLGMEVAVIDPRDPGQGSSYGNAGVLASCSVVPVNHSRLLPKLPYYVLNPNFPLFLIWSRVPVIAPFLVRYLMHATADETKRICNGLTQITADSVKQHKDLAGGTKAERWLQDSEYIFAYESRTQYENDSYVWSLRRQSGFEPIEIEGPELAEYLPAPSSKIGFLAVMDTHGFVQNPGRYVGDLAKSFESAGGKIIKAGVKELMLENGRIKSIDTDQGKFDCSRTVVAAGVWSKQVLKKLDVSVPMETERGYHVWFRSPSFQPRAPLMINSGKFVMTPMNGGLRCAGVLEFGGISAPPSRRSLEFIRKHVAAVFPSLRWESYDEWLGHRPAPIDSLPFIGEIGTTGVFTAFGHHHIGLTSGPKTGRIVAEIIANDRQLIDMKPYLPKRFHT